MSRASQIKSYHLPPISNILARKLGASIIFSKVPVMNWIIFSFFKERSLNSMYNEENIWLLLSPV